VDPATLDEIRGELAPVKVTELRLFQLILQPTPILAPGGGLAWPAGRSAGEKCDFSIRSRIYRSMPRNRGRHHIQRPKLCWATRPQPKRSPWKQFKAWTAKIVSSNTIRDAVVERLVRAQLKIGWGGFPVGIRRLCQGVNDGSSADGRDS